MPSPLGGDRVYSRVTAARQIGHKNKKNNSFDCIDEANSELKFASATFVSAVLMACPLTMNGMDQARIKPVPVEC